MPNHDDAPLFWDDNAIDTDGPDVDRPLDLRDPLPVDPHHVGADIPAAAEQARANSPHDLREQASQTLDVVLASCHGLDADELIPVLDRIESDEILGLLPPERVETIRDVCAVLRFRFADSRNAVVDYTDVPLLAHFPPAARLEVERLHALSGQISRVEPMASLASLVEASYRVTSLQVVNEYRSELLRGSRPDELMSKYRAVAETPPTSLGASTMSTGLALTADVALEAEARLMAGVPSMALACGMPTIDNALTPVGAPVGIIRPGEGLLIAGPTGTGKTSFLDGAVRAWTIDARKQVGEHVLVVKLYVEQSLEDHAKGLQIMPGQRFNHLAGNIVLADVGSDRFKILYLMYELMAQAMDKSAKLGGHWTSYAPILVALDYVGPISGPGERNEVESSLHTAEFFRLGVQKWNFKEMQKYAGQGAMSFEQYTGKKLPTDTGRHQVAVVLMAQLVKQSDEALFYRPGPCQCDWTEQDKRALAAGAQLVNGDLNDLSNLLQVAAAASSGYDVDTDVLARWQQIQASLLADPVVGALWPMTPFGEPMPMFGSLQAKKTFCKTVERICPPADKKVKREDFVLEDDKGNALWDVRDGDLRLLTKNAIRGHGALANNATAILLLHRSRPVNNPALPGVGHDGRAHLSDTRARILVDKARYGSRTTYAPLAFDLALDGGKAQYFDPMGEELVKFRRDMFDLDVFEKPGDPLLPPRGFRSALVDCRYGSAPRRVKAA